MTDEGPPTGHIKLARKLFDPEHGHAYWLEKRPFSRFEAWVDVIQLACFAPYKHVTGHGVVPLERGEFVASRRYLAKRWRWSEKRVRVWIENAEKGAMLRAQRESQAGTVYLVVNYDAYQTGETPEGPAKGPAEGPAGAQQGPKRKAVKRERENGSAFETAWTRYPKRLGSNPKAAAQRAWNARVAEGVAEADLLAGVERYRAHQEARGNVGTEYVMQAVRFFGPSKEYESEWAAPRVVNGGQPQRPRQLSATEMLIGEDVA